MNVFERFIRCDIGFLPFNQCSTADGVFSYINWWTDKEPEKIWFTNFFRKHCNFNEGINFYSVFGSPIYIKRRVSCEKERKHVFYTAENVSYNAISRRFKRYGDHLMDYMDLSMGFDYRSDNNYLRFPVWIITNFSPDSTYESIKRKINEMNSPDFSYDSRDITCSMIARHDAKGIRKQICDSLSTFVEINYEGAWRNNSQVMREKFNNNKLEFLSHVKFNICPENANTHGYVTEKIFDSFKSKCIPIYWGASGKPESDLIDERAFLYWDGSDSFYNNFDLLLSNKKAYLDFVAQPRFKEGAEDVVWSYFLSLRDKINEMNK